MPLANRLSQHNALVDIGTACRWLADMPPLTLSSEIIGLVADLYQVDTGFIIQGVAVHRAAMHRELMK